MISIAYCTAREEPRFEWIADGLSNTGCHNFELIIVDAIINNDRIEKFKSIVKDRFPVQHVEPKPCMWSGKHRLTKNNYFSLSNSRNTALCYAKYGHVAFVDDCAVISDGWLDYHMMAAHKKICMGGPSSKLFGMDVENGRLKKFSSIYITEPDSRMSVLALEWRHKETRPIEVRKEWLYGCNFSVPLQDAINVNGFDEMFDGQRNSEDCDFSIRLSNNGCQIYFHPECSIFESAEDHVRKWHHTYEKKINDLPANSWLANVRLRSGLSWALNLGKNIQAYRNSLANGGTFEIPTEPTEDWRDGKLLMEML